MTGWIATTKSGRTYESKKGGVLVSGEGYFPRPTLRSFPESMIPELSTAEGRINWDKLYALPEVNRPVVGERFLISTFGDAGWRISTEIVNVEDAE